MEQFYKIKKILMKLLKNEIMLEIKRYLKLLIIMKEN